MFARLPGKLCFELRSLLAQKNPVSEYCEYSGTGRINSISRGTTRIECMSFYKKTALLSFACNVCSRNRPTLLSTGQLPGVPFTCSSKRRSQSVTPYSCRSLQGKSPVLRLFYLSIILAQVFFLCKEKFIVFYHLSEKFSEYTAKARSTFCSSCEV